MSWIPWLVGWLWFAPSPPVCRVRVVDVPLPQLRHHKLRMEGRVVPAARFVDVSQAPDEVLLLGPRYTGRAKLPQDCNETVSLHATPLPAQLKFVGLPPRSVLTCAGCPGVESNTNLLPENLPLMVMEDLRTVVSLWVRAPGFHAVEQVVVLYPGENVVRVSMKPRGTGVGQNSAAMRP